MARKQYAGKFAEQGEGSPDAELSDTQQRILAAAARIFAREGYAGATTRAIAAEAGVNEVTLFRNFGNKKRLLMAVIERFSALPGLGAALRGQLSGDYRRDLSRIAHIFLEMMNRNRRAILMTMCEAQRTPELREVVAGPPTHQRQMLGQYLRQQIEQGVVRDLPDPELAAQAFFGMLFEYSIGQLIADPDAPRPSLDLVVAQLVEIFVRGTVRQVEGSNESS